MPDRMIQGLQVQLIIGGNFDKEEVLALLDSSEAYIVASIDGVEEFRIPVSNMPVVSSEWYDLGSRPLPLSKTRFSLPAFVNLRYKMAQTKCHVEEKRNRDVQKEIAEFDAKHFRGAKCEVCGDSGWIHLIDGDGQKRVRCPKCGEKLANERQECGCPGPAGCHLTTCCERTRGVD